MGQGRYVLAGVALLAAGAIAGALMGQDGRWLHWLCKPATTALLLGWVALRPAEGAQSRARRWVATGLALSLLGDVLLMLPQGLFVPGLVAFLLAHLSYIVAFLPGVSARGLLAGVVISGLVAAANLWALWLHLPAAMQGPVAAYVTVIGAMAALALARAFAGLPEGRFAAVGALLFVASDSWLAWDRFAGPLPLAIAGVLVTYWLAQSAIAVSVLGRASLQ